MSQPVNSILIRGINRKADYARALELLMAWQQPNEQTDGSFLVQKSALFVFDSTRQLQIVMNDIDNLGFADLRVAAHIRYGV